MPSSIIEIYSKATEYKHQRLLKSIVKRFSDRGSKLEHSMADLGVLTRTDVKAKVKTCLTNWMQNSQSEIVKILEPTSKPGWSELATVQ